MKKETHLLAHITGSGEPRRRVRAHNMRVNGPPKSGSKHRKSVTSFVVYFCYELISNTYFIKRPS
jgi:hypothetical protein